MQAEDWNLLGLSAPTTDLLAIKRAYAARLKQTRPDDDAEAYQRLRQTYEWAQHWARGAAEHRPQETEPSSGSDRVVPEHQPVATTPRADPPPAAAPPADQLAPPAPAPSIQALLEAAGRAWREQGEAGLMAHWPVLQAGLDALPLSDLPEASARLADAVIEVPELPESWLLALDRHFGWREDFRTARLIGMQRAQALHAALDERTVRPITDAEVLQRFEPLTRVARLAAGGRRAQAVLHAALSGGTVQHLADMLPARQWRALGIDAVDHLAALRALGRAVKLRVALGVLMLALVMTLAGRELPETLIVLAGGGVICTLAYVLTAGLAARLHDWFGLRRQATPLADRLRAWHGRPRRLAVGFGALGASALAGAWAGGPAAPFMPVLPWVPWLLLLVVGALALWPQDPRHGVVVLPCAVTGLAIALGVLPAESGFIGTPWAVALSLGLAWALLAVTAYERAWWGIQDQRAWAAPQVWPLAPVVNSLALCDRWGVLFALSPLPVLVGLVHAGIVSDTPWRLFIGWTLLVLAFGWAQSLLFGWGQRLASGGRKG